MQQICQFYIHVTITLPQFSACKALQCRSGIPQKKRRRKKLLTGYTQQITVQLHKSSTPLTKHWNRKKREEEPNTEIVKTKSQTRMPEETLHKHLNKFWPSGQEANSIDYKITQHSIHNNMQILVVHCRLCSWGTENAVQHQITCLTICLPRAVLNECWLLLY